MNVELVAIECSSFVVFELKAHSRFILVFIYPYKEGEKNLVPHLYPTQDSTTHTKFISSQWVFVHIFIPNWYKNGKGL